MVIIYIYLKKNLQAYEIFLTFYYFYVKKNKYSFKIYKIHFIK